MPIYARRDGTGMIGNGRLPWTTGEINQHAMEQNLLPILYICSFLDALEATHISDLYIFISITLASRN